MGPISYSVTFTRLERLTRVKHSSLFGPFANYEENEMLEIRLKIPTTSFEWRRSTNEWWMELRDESHKNLFSILVVTTAR